MAARSKFNAEVAKRLVLHARAGLDKATAARLQGIGRTTLHEWLTRGDSDDAGDGDAAFVDFAAAYFSAEAEHRAEVLGKVLNPPEGTAGEVLRGWRWWLERTAPREYGARTVLEHVGADGGPVQLAGAVAMYLPTERTDDDEPREPEPQR